MEYKKILWNSFILQTDFHFTKIIWLSMVFKFFSFMNNSTTPPVKAFYQYSLFTSTKYEM